MGSMSKPPVTVPRREREQSYDLNKVVNALVPAGLLIPVWFESVGL